jgi:photosystem II stability/assembly factor-like uncharacterized protein
MRVVALAAVVIVSTVAVAIGAGSAGASGIAGGAAQPAGWSVLNTSTDNPYLSVSCPTDDDCVAVGESGPTGMNASIGATSDGGSIWIPESVPANVPGLTSVSCGSLTQCVAVGTGEGPNEGTTAILSTRNGGTRWQETIPSTNVYSLTSVSCASGSHCIAVGNQLVGSSTSGVILGTTDGGRIWKQQAESTELPQLTGVSCPTTEHCVAVAQGLASGNTGAIVLTVNGGKTWTIESQPVDAPTLTGVSCGSDTVCVAVGGTFGNPSGVGNFAIATYDGGTRWSEVALPGSAAAIDCPSATDCAAVGLDAEGLMEQAFVTLDGGNSWSAQSMPLEVTDLFGISCPSESACISVGYSDSIDSPNPYADLVVGSTTAFSGLVSTTVTPSASPAIALAGEPTTLTASVAPVAGKGTPTGTVTFTAGAVTLCTAKLNAGNGSCRASDAPLGIDTVVASYSGDTTYFPASATLSLSVSSVSCAHGTGSLSNDGGFTLTFSSCTPVSKENRRATLTGSILGESGSIVWTPSGQTTDGSLQAFSSPAGQCPKGASEYNVDGTVTSGTSTYTHGGDAVTIPACLNMTTLKVTLAKGTAATF